VPSASYEIRIRGRLSASLHATFDPLTAYVKPTDTVLCGRIEDQATLHAFLERIEALGLELVEIRRVGEVRCTSSGDERRKRGPRPDSQLLGRVEQGI
jgi:hypothetical protein